MSTLFRHCPGGPAVAYCKFGPVRGQVMSCDDWLVANEDGVLVKPVPYSLTRFWCSACKSFNMLRPSNLTEVPMSITTRINPATGKLETVGSPDTDEAAEQRKSLEKTRRELRDMLAGNVQFHTDTLGPGPAAPPVALVPLWPSSHHGDDLWPISSDIFADSVGRFGVITAQDIADKRDHGIDPKTDRILLRSDYEDAGITAKHGDEIGCAVVRYSTGSAIRLRYVSK
jgi:hypothetical protein